MSAWHPYGTEAELCEAFAECAAMAGWRAYPECGYDLLLVDEHGTRVGVEAKLRCNLDVVAQVLPRYPGCVRAHYFGVLVPSCSESLRTVCLALQIHVWDEGWIKAATSLARYGNPDLRKNAGNLFLREAWRKDPTKLIKIPAVPLQGNGGVPSPRCMSGWRESALRLCLLLESKGYLTRNDIKAEGISPTIWTTRYLVPDGEEPGPRGRPITKYVAHPDHGLPSQGYEKELEAMRKVLPRYALGLRQRRQGGKDSKKAIEPRVDGRSLAVRPTSKRGKR